MPSDPKLLRALSLSTRCELRYFELCIVSVKPSAPDDNLTKRELYVCLGKHAIWFVDSYLQVVKNGCFQYEAVSEIVEDEDSHVGLLLACQSLGKQVEIICENRHLLVTRIRIQHQVDTMSRLSELRVVPVTCRRLPQFNQHHQAEVKPFKDYETVTVSGYSMFLRKGFRDEQSPHGRVFLAPLTAFGSFPSLERDSAVEVEVAVHVYDPVHNDCLAEHEREHIRWLATEYRQALSQAQRTYLIRNQGYVKRMNLSNDIAQWHAWEVVLHGLVDMNIIMCLRRQYMPPLLDSVQDIAITFKFPARVADSKLGNTSLRLEDLIRSEAHLAADSFSTVTHNLGLYQDFVEVKLNTLSYDEEGYMWAKSRMRLLPRGPLNLDIWGYVFTKGCLKVLIEETCGIGDLRYVFDEVVKELHVLTKRVPDINDEMDPLPVALTSLQYPPDDTDWSNPTQRDLKIHDLHGWQKRVATYLTFCVDGGLLGQKFTLKHFLTGEEAPNARQLLGYLVHLRPRELKDAWERKPLHLQLGAMDVKETTFNDRVMHALIESNYIRDIMSDEPGSRPEGSGAKVVQMSSAYAEILSKLMLSKYSSINLKASICRIIIKEKEPTHCLTLCTGLLSIYAHGGIFLATYACAALVNLSHSKEEVKSHIMGEGVASVCKQRLASKDDDLTLYTLMLLVHLTKLAQHRALLKQLDILGSLNRLLNTWHKAVRFKRRMLVELCCVIGQMCNNEDCRQYIVQNFHTVDDLLYIYNETTKEQKEQIKDRSTLASKAIFALKQLCVNTLEEKEKVGKHVIKSLVEHLRDPQNLENLDWVCNSIMMLSLLAISRSCCALIENNGWKETYDAIQRTTIPQNENIGRRLMDLHQRITQATKKVQADS